MARKFASVQAAIWEPGSDFRELSLAAQWAYVMLLSQPQITNVGVLTYSPGKWARLANGMTSETVEASIDELAAGWFVLVDRDAGELLIRTYIKHDGLWKMPKLVISARRQFREIESEEIRDHLLARHPWLADETWKQPQIREHEEAQAEPVSQRVNEPVSQPVREGTPERQGLLVAGPRLQAQQQDQELRTTNLDHNKSAAAELESPRDAQIAAAADRYAADLPVVEAEARQLPSLLFDDVVERVNTRCNTGTIGNPAGLLIDLLRRARREAAKREIRETEPRSLMQIACDDAKSYARGQHPWDVANELLARKLARLGAENGTSEALLAAAHAAYRTESARSETP